MKRLKKIRTFVKKLLLKNQDFQEKTRKILSRQTVVRGSDVLEIINKAEEIDRLTNEISVLATLKKEENEYTRIVLNAIREHVFLIEYLLQSFLLETYNTELEVLVLSDEDIAILRDNAKRINREISNLNEFIA